MAYDTIDQNIVASCLIQSYTDDSFYNPVVNQHTGYAYDGNYYSLGVLDSTHPQASWFTEFGTNSFRGDQAKFPSYGLVLLSPASLGIFDQSQAVALASDLPLWMQFVLGDNNALTNNFNASVQGFSPAGVTYADGIISVIYAPDSGNQKYPNSTLMGTITATSVTSNVLTVTTSNQFTVGQKVTLNGTAEAFLNGVPMFITSLIGLGPTYTGFTANFSTPDYSNPADTGTAVVALPFKPPYPGTYPIVPSQSHMVVSIDFTQDSVYLDVAV